MTKIQKAMGQRLAKWMMKSGKSAISEVSSRGIYQAKRPALLSDSKK